MNQDNKYNKDNNKKYGLALFTALPLLMAQTLSRADDTEIFTAFTPTTTDSNVVFVIDTSGSMGNTPLNAPAGSDSKLTIVKHVFENLIFDKNPDGTPNHNLPNPKLSGLNIAVMRFDNNNVDNTNDAEGGYFLSDMKKLNNGNFKDQLWNAINGDPQVANDHGLEAGGLTPLAETAYEAALYFQGAAPRYGLISSPGTNPSAIMAGSNYKSPFSNTQALQSQCSINNHLVILTDGKPTTDGSADNDIKALPNAGTCGFDANAYTSDCLPMVAKYLYNHDFVDTINGVQNVKTHTIAFDLQETAAVELLRQTAENGGGMAANASNASELADAFSNILTEVIDTATSFVSPAVSISNSNRFVHDNTVYLGLFKPEVAPRWTGNLKGYQLSSTGQLLDFSNPPQAALTGSGEIATTAKSKWSSAIDGNTIGAGGAASRIGTQLSRNIKTQNSTTPASHDLVDFNALNVTNADLGVTTDPDREAVVNWASSTTLNPIGDPLHSTPQVIRYNNNESYIVFGTNQGFLHFIDASSGLEKFAFIPKALLGNLKVFKDNFTRSAHPYGLDGPITVYVKDGNNDGVITASDTSNDLVLIIVGMRRGGNSYYAINATDINNPKLQWQITGGSGNFAALGQTWAKPIVLNMHFGSTSAASQPVVVLSGGYDTQYDGLTTTPVTPKGNAIYAVNLMDGSLVWSATGGAASASTTHLTVPEMTDAIPSEISAIDYNSDGVADRLYAIDVMGHIIRIDFDTSVGNDYIPQGQLFANLAVSGSSRRFYYSVDVAYTNTDKPKLHISVGSGHRPHPLDTNSHDTFFSVWDTHVKDALGTGYTALTVNDLTPVDTLTDTTTITNGWYFNVTGSGEKILSQASSMSGYVFFTTYMPPTGNTTTTSCTPPIGSANLYAVKLGNSEALSNARAIPLQYTGIPPSPTFMALDATVTDNTNPYASTDTRRVVLVGGQDPLSDADEDKLNQGDTSKTYWQIVN